MWRIQNPFTYEPSAFPPYIASHRMLYSEDFHLLASSCIFVNWNFQVSQILMKENFWNKNGYYLRKVIWKVDILHSVRYF